MAWGSFLGTVFVPEKICLIFQDTGMIGMKFPGTVETGDGFFIFPKPVIADTKLQEREEIMTVRKIKAAILNIAGGI